MKDSFVIYSSYERFFKRLGPQRGYALIMAIFKYAETGEVEYFKDEALDIAYSSIIGQMKRDGDKYSARVETAKKAANARWNKKVSKRVEECNSNANAMHEHGVYVSDSVSVSESVSDNVSVSVSDSVHVPTEHEVERYVTERGLNVDGHMFWRYYNERNWMTGDKPVKDWKALATKWSNSAGAKFGNHKVAVPDFIQDQIDGKVTEFEKPTNDQMSEALELQKKLKERSD